MAIRRVAAFRALAGALWGARSPGTPGVGERFRAIPRMLAQGFTGRYPLLDRSRIVLAAAGLVYVISPVDLIPEIILPLLGLADDTLVAGWVVGALLSETETFLTWERQQREPTVRVVAGEVLE